MRKWILLLPAMMIALAACDTRAKKADRVKELRLAYERAPGDTAAAARLNQGLNEFAADYPKDTLSADMLYLSASINANTLHNLTAAQQAFEKVYTGFPDSRRAADAMFAAAYLYRNEMNDSMRANELYRRLIHRFPQSPYADQSRLLLEQGDANNAEFLQKILEQRRQGKRPDSMRQQ